MLSSCFSPRMMRGKKHRSAIVFLQCSKFLKKKIECWSLYNCSRSNFSCGSWFWPFQLYVKMTSFSIYKNQSSDQRCAWGSISVKSNDVTLRYASCDSALANYILKTYQLKKYIVFLFVHFSLKNWSWIFCCCCCCLPCNHCSNWTWEEEL